MKKRLTSIGLAIVSLTMTFGATRAATRTVGKASTGCPNPQYSTITAAINAAAPGDEVLICPALYKEQLVIGKPLTLRGIAVNGFNRVLIQPSPVSALLGLPVAAVIAVINTTGVTIQDLAIDASDNTVKGCDIALAGIRFLNSSGTVQGNALFGTQLKNPQSCPALYPGNGFGVHIDASIPGTFQVLVRDNSIHDFGRNGILAVGSGVTAEILGNSISGVGPSSGSFQFGVFIAFGAVGRVTANVISEDTCGPLTIERCLNQRTEGVVLRSAGDGTLVDSNIITDAQTGIFLNGAKSARITNNFIKNMDVLSGIHVQITTNSLFAGNRIYTIKPTDNIASEWQEGCGINEISNSSNAANTFRDNLVSDAYCGIAHVTTSQVFSGVYINTLYDTFNSDLYPVAYPPATEPD